MKLSFNFLFLTLALWISAINPAAATENPLIDMGFSEEHTVDLLKVCFHEVLDCKLLSRQSESGTQWVVLVGESHNQPRVVRDIGAKLLKHHSVIGVEATLTDRLEGPLHKLSRATFGRFYKAPDENDEKAWTKKNEYSLLYIDSYLATHHKTIFNLENGYKSKCPHDQKDQVVLSSTSKAVAVMGLSAVFSYFYGDNPISSIATVLGPVYLFNALRNFDPHGKIPGSPNVTPEAMRERDRIMGENILKAVEETKETSVAGVMGSAHVYGVTRLLVAAGFKDHQPELLVQGNSLLDSGQLDSFTPAYASTWKIGSQYYPQDSQLKVYLGELMASIGNPTRESWAADALRNLAFKNEAIREIANLLGDPEMNTRENALTALIFRYLLRHPEGDRGREPEVAALQRAATIAPLSRDQIEQFAELVW